MKRQVYYPRTYRRLKNNYIKSGLYLLVTVFIPLYYLYRNIGTFTNFVSNTVIGALNQVLPSASPSIHETTFSFMGLISYVDLKASVISPYYLEVQIIATILILIICVTGRRHNVPFFMFCFFEGLGFLINCIYFYFKAADFPYSINDFSQLYMKQQLGIWIAFIIIYGVTTAFIGEKGYRYKLLSTFLLGGYSFVFGVVRYIVFLYVLSKYSTVYMYFMFFTLGPLFDFLYLVEFYGILINKLIKIYDGSEGENQWEWY
ncbi:hypothetical protein SAMN05421767_1168 [Granulicatella balaenopterae]|uniref:Uncharacterized protein n=1 Tax=Granulicatella balaenopterae TaxID=137733 RepID=A0A1H9KX42_9LACT|nr:hypothetical protein [Granulicatella balaenopterae]SER03791.1 hypothetical protein SAMN05421767_1168 [Granulicatella balaenopterae]